MAKVRTLFKEEIEALLPLLHETYRRIGTYQKDRSQRNERALVDQLDRIAGSLYFFKEWLQPKKQPYFDALLDGDLSISDRIVGIVTDIGGSLCHAAIVARERGIPCVVGTQRATELIRNKMLISVDGNKGTVKKIR